MNQHVSGTAATRQVLYICSTCVALVYYLQTRERTAHIVKQTTKLAAHLSMMAVLICAAVGHVQVRLR
jgi:hypothetical protein